MGFDSENTKDSNLAACRAFLGGVTKPEMLRLASEADLPIIKPKMFAGFLHAVLVFACLSARAQESSASTFPFWLAVVSLSGCQRLRLAAPAAGGCVA